MRWNLYIYGCLTVEEQQIEDTWRQVELAKLLQLSQRVQSVPSEGLNGILIF